MTEMLMARLMTVIEFLVIIGIAGVVTYLAIREAAKPDTMNHPPIDKFLDNADYLRRVNDGMAWRRFWMAGRNLKNKE